MLNHLRGLSLRFYIIRCTAGRDMLALTWRGAISELKRCGPDASVHTLNGQWLAGRRVAA